MTMRGRSRSANKVPHKVGLLGVLLSSHLGAKDAHLGDLRRIPAGFMNSLPSLPLAPPSSLSFFATKILFWES